MRRRLAIIVCVALLGCPSSNEPASSPSSRPVSTATSADPAPSAPPAEPFAHEVAMSMKVESPSFLHEAPIPKKHTCEGGDTSPALSWSGVPAGTKSLALVVDDPDAPDPKAPKMTWVHWVLFDMPPDGKGLDEGAGKGGALPPGTKVGKNDWKRQDYGGPCPPKGRHRYFHKLYALDAVLGIEAPTKADLEKAMTGHVLARGELIGTYQKGDP